MYVRDKTYLSFNSLLISAGPSFMLVILISVTNFQSIIELERSSTDLMFRFSKMHHSLLSKEATDVNGSKYNARRKKIYEILRTIISLCVFRHILISNMLC